MLLFQCNIAELYKFDTFIISVLNGGGLELHHY